MRWHGQPIGIDVPTDGLPESIESIRDDPHASDFCKSDGRGQANEILTRDALLDEGASMHHCVGTYWRQCVLDGVRIVHLALADGEVATAQYRLAGPPDNPTFEFEELRGPHNAAPSRHMREFARMTRVALNAAAFQSRRVHALQDANEAWAAETTTVITDPIPGTPSPSSASADTVVR